MRFRAVVLALATSLHCTTSVEPQLSVGAPSASPPAPDSTSPSVGAARSAELPRAVPAVPAGLDALPCTSLVPAGGLQGALASARGGAVLCLRGVHRGNFTVPARADAGWVVVRSQTLPPPGRIRPTTSGGVARLESPNTLAALAFAPRAARTLVLGLEIAADSTRNDGPVALVQVGTGQETTLADLATDIAFDQVYIHGTASQHIRRAFAANGGAFTLTRSWCEEIHATGFDSQCVISWAGSGPMLIEDNHLSAASENLMFGGADPRVPGLTPSDITIRRNHVYKPASWMGKHWNVKNLVETKASRRVLIEENVLEGQWFDAAPGHAAVVIKSASQAGTCPKCDTSDWTVRRNLFRDIGTWLSIAGRADQGKRNDGGGPISGATDSTVRRVAILENWVEGVAVPPYTNENRPNIIFVADNHDVTLERNVVAGAGPMLESAILFDVSGAIKTPVVNLTVRDNVLPRGRYGMFTSAMAEGLPSWRAGALGASTWAGNAMIGTSSAAYPPGTSWHVTVASALGAARVTRAAIDAGVEGVVIAR